MIEAGVSGFLHKLWGLPEIAVAIRTVMKGKSYYCQTTYIIMNELFQLETKRETLPLSIKQTQILKHVGDEKSIKEISSLMDNMNENCIKTHIMRIKEKLDVHSHAGLVKAAIKMNLTNLYS